MKKSEFTGRPNFSVAMSQDTGCIVMVKTTGATTTVMGSLTRDQSIEFAKSLIAWVPTLEDVVKEAVKPKLSLVN